jgi:NAD+ kinase
VIVLDLADRVGTTRDGRRVRVSRRSGVAPPGSAGTAPHGVNNIPVEHLDRALFPGITVQQVLDVHLLGYDYPSGVAAAGTDVPAGAGGADASDSFRLRSVAAHPRPDRVAIVVHPTRPVTAALETLDRWAGQHGLEVVQLQVAGGPVRELSPRSELEPGDLVVALGGDGTVLAALRASAPASAPVLGVACGSLGALTAVAADRLGDALDRMHAGDWTPRPLPALAIHPDGAPEEWALNDFVVARRGAGQVLADLYVDDELYVRIAGDGLVVATPLGSSAYSMAAGGPVLLPGTPAVVCTPLAMHGGNAPPLVVPTTSSVRVQVHASHAGFEIQADGHAMPLTAASYRLSLHDEKVTLVSFGRLRLGLAGLRERRLITDSARVLARDDRTNRPGR